MCPEDRTEAQQRAALHAHILGWFMRRLKPTGYVPIKPLKREAPGTEPRQRPITQKPDPLEHPQEDAIYHDAHCGRAVAELVRPEIKAANNWGGWNIEKMRIAFLARAVQTRLPYIHNCSSAYCLKNRLASEFNHGALISNNTKRVSYHKEKIL